MAGWVITLLGGFSLRRHDHHVAELEGRKAQELLCYLLLHRDRTHAREALATLLWPTARPSLSKSYIRKALWQVQTALDMDGGLSAGLLEVGSDAVRVSRQADVWTDVAAFEWTFSHAKAKTGAQLDLAEFEALQSALDLYRGELLAGWYEEWCVYDRERLELMYLSMLDKVMGYCETHQRWDEGITYGARILRIETAQERTHQRLMRLHYLAGDRTAALRQFDQCVAALRRELDVQPDEPTLALYHQIRSNTLLHAPPAPPPAPEESVTRSAPLDEVLKRLQEFRATLADMQRQIEADIHFVRGTLDADK